MTDDPRDRNCLSPVCSEVRYMTDDPREAGTVYPRFSVKLVTRRMITEKQELFTPEFSVRFVTRRMIIEKQKLFTPVFSEVRYMTDDHRETGTV